MHLSVIGTGYVGLVTGACLANMGNDVVCHDIDTQKIEGLNKGKLPIYEPGLEEIVKRNVQDKRLFFSTDLEFALKNVEICFIAVGTPPDEDGSADRRHVLGAAAMIGEIAQGPLVVVVKSTVPVGTCDRVRNILVEKFQQRKVDWEFDVVSNPEFLKEGKAVEDFIRPDRIVLGTSNTFGLEKMRSLYSYFMRNGHACIEMDLRSAEMTKYAANVMLATRISLMNELAHICEKVNADIMSVRKGIGSDKRIGLNFLYAGAGYGGSCFPKDVKALSAMAVEADCPADILDAVEKVNRYQRMLVANKVLNCFQGDVKGRHFALWGLSFKPKTDDIREAPALVVLKRLIDAGATVCAYDPEAMPNTAQRFEGLKELKFASGMYDALDNADALLLMTEWSIFRRPNFERMKSKLKKPIIFDGRNQYQPSEMNQLGFDYYCIGRRLA